MTAYQQNEDGSWTPAEPLPYYPSLGERLAAEVKHVVQTVGYWIRPYDMLADRRRWFWQPRQRCGADRETIALLTRLVEERERDAK